MRSLLARFAKFNPRPHVGKPCRFLCARLDMRTLQPACTPLPRAVYGPLRIWKNRQGYNRRVTCIRCGRYGEESANISREGTKFARVFWGMTALRLRKRSGSSGSSTQGTS